ncbi:HLH-domain-containing protein [Atractiella rhizophila]|nr:HLH-domain-containing protein [Atractiella rhizophila]
MSLYIGAEDLTEPTNKQPFYHALPSEGTHQQPNGYIDFSPYDLGTGTRDDVVNYNPDPYVRSDQPIHPAAYFPTHTHVPPATHAASPSLESPVSFSPFSEDFMSTRRTSVASLARTGMTRKPSPATRGRQPYPSTSYSTSAIVIPNTTGASAVYSSSWLNNAPSPGFGYSGSPDDWLQTIPASAPVMGVAAAPKVSKGTRSRSFPRKEEESVSLNEVLLEKKKKRRESHNLVERRRRDNINERIAELATLIPPAMLEFNPDLDDPEGRQKSSQALAAQSKLNKGSILTKTVQYIRNLQEIVYLQSQKLQELGAGDDEVADRTASVLAVSANPALVYGHSLGLDSPDVNDGTGESRQSGVLEEEGMEVESST